MKLTDNDQRVIEALLEDHNISNLDLAKATFMSLPSLHQTLKSLYTKFDVDGAGRQRRTQLITKLQEGNAIQ